MKGLVRLITGGRLVSTVVMPILLGALVSCAFLCDLTRALPLPDFGFYAYPWWPAITVGAMLLVLSLMYLLVTRLGLLFRLRNELAVAMCIVPAALTGFNLGRLDLGDLAILSLTIFWVSTTLVEHRSIHTPLPMLCFLAMLVFFVCASVINGWFTSLVAIHTIFTKILLLFLISNILVTPRLHDLAVRMLIFIAAVSALVAIGSEVLYLTSGIEFTFDDLRNEHHKDTPIGTMLRVTAFLPGTQSLAHLLILAASLSLFVPMSLTKRLILLSLFMLGTTLTFSAGGFLSIAVVLVVSLFIRHPHRAPVYLACLSGASLLLYVSGALTWLYEKVVIPVSGAGVQDRLEYVRIGLHAVERHPLLGGGFKNIRRVLNTTIHNAYLQTSADIGLIGGAVFTMMIGYLTVACGALILQARTQADRNLLKGCFLGMIGVCVHFAVEPFYDNLASWMFLGLITSTLVVYSDARPMVKGNDADAA